MTSEMQGAKQKTPLEPCCLSWKDGPIFLELPTNPQRPDPKKVVNRPRFFRKIGQYKLLVPKIASLPVSSSHQCFLTQNDNKNSHRVSPSFLALPLFDSKQTNIELVVVPRYLDHSRLCF